VAISARKPARYPGSPTSPTSPWRKDGDKYIAIPGKRELDLGKPLVLDSARDILRKDFEEIRDIFGRRGAYQNFKALLARRGALDRCYEYEAKATEEALRQWCRCNEIELTD
jgi:hypothetical protein